MKKSTVAKLLFIIFLTVSSLSGCAIFKKKDCDCPKFSKNEASPLQKDANLTTAKWIISTDN